MKYCIIEELIDYRVNITKLLFAVESEEIAKDLCKRYNGLTYKVVETEKETETDD